MIESGGGERAKIQGPIDITVESEGLEIEAAQDARTGSRIDPGKGEIGHKWCAMYQAGTQAHGSTALLEHSQARMVAIDKVVMMQRLAAAQAVALPLQRAQFRSGGLCVCKEETISAAGGCLATH